MLELITLGGLQIRCGETPLTGFESRKAQALLVYLAVERRPHTRSALAGLLWADCTESRARGNLRRVLSNLRRLAGPHLQITTQTVAFDAGSSYRLDAQELEKLVNWDGNGPPSFYETVDLYRGDFLDGFYLRGTPVFEEWMLGWRERLRTTILQALHSLATYHGRRGEHAEAIVWAGRLLALAPWREEAHRQMMQLLALTGQRSAALVQYETCRRYLATELDLPPLEETTALYERIRDSAPGAFVGPGLDATEPGIDGPGNLPFVGRGEEHARLIDWWKAGGGGVGGLTLVEGEAGVGKTRLVEEFMRHAATRGARVLRGLCYDFGSGVPFQPIAMALRSALDDGDPKPGSRLGGPNLEAVWLAELSRLLPELRQRWPDLPQPIQEPGEPARQGLFEAVARVLLALAGNAVAARPGAGRWAEATRPLILFLDDLHWADPSTLDLLHYLARRLQEAPIWLVGAYRPEEAGLRHPLTRLRQGLGRDHLVNRLALAPLPPDMVERVARSLVGEAGAAALGRFLYRESEGNPFILSETVSSLQEQGVLCPEGAGLWRWTGPPQEERLPAGVRDLVLQRVGRLDEAVWRLLRLAAVLGRAFDVSLLQAISGADAATVENSLDEWLARRLVRRHPTSYAQYDLSHDKIRAVIYYEIELGRRRALHRQVAEALERWLADRIEAEAGLLAHHWAESDRPERATGYLLAAGDQAHLVYAYREAIDYYRRALVYLKEQGEQERAARTLMKLGLTYHNNYDFGLARQAYAEGFGLWQQTGEVEPARPLPPAPHALRVRWFEPATLDPTMSPDTHTSCLMAHLYSGLAQLTPGMAVVPDVARSWEVSEGGHKFVFFLRDDVRWSDGTAVTAHDFEYGWKRALDPATGSPAAGYMFEIEGARAFHLGEGRRQDVGVQALDALTLAVTLARPAGYFPQLLTQVPYYPLPRHVVEGQGAAWTEVEPLVSNGPFRLQAWDRGVSVVLARNPEYHGRFRGNLQEVKLFSLAEPSVRLERYEAGGLDVLGIAFFSPAEQETVRQRHADEYVQGPNAGAYYVAFDAGRPPFDDRRVRRALVMATDRETLADVVMRGYVSPATGGFVPPGMPGHSPGIGLPYDPDGARQLLAEAGYPGGRGFPVLEALSFRAVESRSEYLRVQWQDILGVEIAWETLEWTAFLDRLNAGFPHVFNVIWDADYPDPDNFMRVSRARTWAHWRNKAYDRLVEEARRATDQKERMRLYGEADRILVDESPILPLTYERDHLLVKPWVSRYPTSALRGSFWQDVVIEAHE